MSAIREDLAYAWRSLGRTPGFTAVVVATLALGIGATSAMFSVLDTVLLRPLPFPAADRVTNLAWQGSAPLQSLSAMQFQYWRDHARSFDAMATWQPALARVDFGGEVSAVRVLEVSRDFFQVVGFQPALGRAFDGDEHATTQPSVAVITHTMWRRRFGGAVDVVGRTIRLSDAPLTIVGVLPESFDFPYEDGPLDLLVPLSLRADPDDIAENWPAIARLRSGVTRELGQADVASLTDVFRREYPNQVSKGDRGMTLAAFGDLYVADAVQRALWILMGAVALVLLIACANVAHLFLARALRRRGEIALRAALGATRGRIGRLLLAESLLVALAAGGCGLMAGRWMAAVLVALTPTAVPRMTDIGIDWRVALFTSAIALVTSLLIGGMAAWPAARRSQSDLLKEHARGTSGQHRLRQGFLLAQSALAVVLLVGAGLLLATLVGLTRVDAGFKTAGLMAIRFPSRPPNYDTSTSLWAMEQRLAQQLAGSPVVAAIAGASSLPLERGINVPMTIGSRPDAMGTVEWRAVTPSYFQTLGIALRAGRTFAEIDVEAGRAVAIVNESFARRYFPGESAIGQRIEVGRIEGKFIDPVLTGPGVEIVGVVADIREVSLRAEPRRTMYVPQAQAPALLSKVMRAMPVFVAASERPRRDVEQAIAQALRAVDPGLPKPQVFPLGDVVARSLARERFGATLLSGLAALALALTASGIYGVLAYSVQQRRREIGIRVALGARRGEVARLVMRQGMVPVLAGIALGILASFGVSRFIQGFLWGVAPTDPSTIALVAATLVVTSVLAGWMPARVAARTNPVESLKAE